MRDFWNSDIYKLYNKEEIINYAKWDIALLLKEREEMEKILDLLNVIETNFNKEGINE